MYICMRFRLCREHNSQGLNGRRGIVSTYSRTCSFDRGRERLRRRVTGTIWVTSKTLGSKGEEDSTCLDSRAHLFPQCVALEG